jgi:hypothetical protein
MHVDARLIFASLQQIHRQPQELFIRTQLRNRCSRFIARDWLTEQRAKTPTETGTFGGHDLAANQQLATSN